jgi:hypothetical protein
MVTGLMMPAFFGGIFFLTLVFNGSTIFASLASPGCVLTDMRPKKNARATNHLNKVKNAPTSLNAHYK